MQVFDVVSAVAARTARGAGSAARALRGERFEVVRQIFRRYVIMSTAALDTQ